MGMDVFGVDPTSKAGEYFRATVWYWHPLATYVQGLDEVAQKCKYWHSNDGDGLGGADAQQLAAAVEKQLGNGRTDAYITERNAAIAVLPDEECPACEGSGVRRDAIGVEKGFVEKVIPADAKAEDEESPHPRAGETGWCNACAGRGHSRPLGAYYQLSRETIERFAGFLRDCGGFEIC